MTPTQSRATRSTTRAIALALPAAMLLGACGAEVEGGADASAEVSIENCGETRTYPRPEKAIAYDMSSIEKMFALGLQDRMRGMVLPASAADPAARSTYAEDYEATENLSTDVLSLETVVDSEADWVLAGWSSGFSEERGITPARLDELGIGSYQHTESCFTYGEDPVVVPPLEALYTDLEQIGEVFGVEDRAEAVVTDIEDRFAALEERRTPGEGPRTFIYDSGTSAPYTSGAQGMPHEIVERAGAEHVFGDLQQRWTEVGWEAVVERDPEVIAVVDYGDQPVEDKIGFLKSHPGLRTTPAVRNDRFYVLDYGLAVSGPRNVDAAEQLADWLEEEGL